MVYNIVGHPSEHPLLLVEGFRLEDLHVLHQDSTLSFNRNHISQGLLCGKTPWNIYLRSTAGPRALIHRLSRWNASPSKLPFWLMSEDTIIFCQAELPIFIFTQAVLLSNLPLSWSKLSGQIRLISVIKINVRNIVYYAWLLKPVASSNILVHKVRLQKELCLRKKIICRFGS